MISHFYFIGTTSIGMSVWNNILCAMLGLNNLVNMFLFLFGITTISISFCLRNNSKLFKKSVSSNNLYLNLV